jgi:hypothetical protein
VTGWVTAPRDADVVDEVITLHGRIQLCPFFAAFTSGAVAPAKSDRHSFHIVVRKVNTFS